MAGEQLSIRGFLSKTKASDTATGGKISQAFSSNAGQPDVDGTVSGTETESTSPGEQSPHNETVSDSQTSDAECGCTTRDKPNQPTCKHALSRTKRFQGSQTRYVQGNWFKDQTLLTLCTMRQKLICFPCTAAAPPVRLVRFSPDHFSARKARRVP